MIWILTKRTRAVVLLIASLGMITVFIIALKQGSYLRRFSSQIRFEDGTRTNYYPNGTIRSVYTYRNDKLNGDGLEFYEDGKTKYQDYWENGQLIARKIFDRQGNVTRVLGHNP